MFLSITLGLLLQSSMPTDNDSADWLTPPMPKLDACKLPDVALTTSLSELPTDVRVELLRVFKGNLADANGPFNPTDVIDPRNPTPQRRFLRAYHHQRYWIIWYEHGGIGYHLHALGLTQNPDRSGPAAADFFARYTGETSQQLCAATRAFFDGAQTSNDF